jgi:hypothetical protein
MVSSQYNDLVPIKICNGQKKFSLYKVLNFILAQYLIVFIYMMWFADSTIKGNKHKIFRLQLKNSYLL